MIKASFVASMRPELTPEWLDVIAPNSNRNTDVAIGDSRYREAGNVINSYDARVAASVVWYATGDKEGTTRLHWNRGRFVSFTEGDHIAWPPVADAVDFLDRLGRIVNLPNHHAGDTPGTSADTWRLILRQRQNRKRVMLRQGQSRPAGLWVW
jgi:hypothetical protein